VGKKLLTTPRSRVKAALRQVWLRSRERAAALKREGYCCERCHAKGSKAKGKEVALEVHHRNGINWDGVVDMVMARLLPDPAELEVLCTDCHDKEHTE
jgi:5-methylcytosine-specific restriction endonuclease McrA